MGAPSFSGASINAACTQLTTSWVPDEPQNVNHSTGVPTVRVAAKGISITCTYASGDGTATIVWTLDTAGTICAGDTVVVDIPADSVRHDGTAEPNAVQTGAAVTNNSTVPGLSSASINAAGTVITTVWTVSANSNGTPTVLIGSRSIATTYSAGDGGDTISWTLASTVLHPSSVVVTCAADTVRNAADARVSAAFTRFFVTNGSRQTRVRSARARRVARVSRA